MNEEMDLSDDLNDILFLIEDNVFVRWRIDYNFFNQSVYGRLFERGNLRFRDYGGRNLNLPEIKGEPNTKKLQKTMFYQRVDGASSSPASRSSLGITRNRRRQNPSSLVHMLQQRERNSWRTPSKRYVNNMFVPNSVKGSLPMTDKFKYCSVYSPDDGRHLLVASVDGHVTVFNTEGGRYTEVARYCIEQTTYSLLDLDVSPNGREFLCSTWKNAVFTCNVLEEDDINQNNIRSNQLVEHTNTNKLGTFSACFNNDGTELIASSNEGCIYVYDRTRNERTLQVRQDVREDINAVRFLDRTNNNVIIGAANNGIIEIWDRRTLSNSGSSGNENDKNQKSVGTLFGHFDGVTYIDSKNDGRYFITNSKDQSVKLWDVRKVGQPGQLKKTRKLLTAPRWNYLSENIPTEFYGEKKPLDGDCSVMTYRGHRVTQTLIRAKFSPVETTGQRFIYTGCSTGRIVFYDTLTGRMHSKIDSHSELVRDVSWHPQQPELVSASFDECVNLNVYAEKETVEAEPLRRSRRIAAKRARDSSV